MDAIPPPNRRTEQITGISCPECPGVLGVVRRKHHLTFRCRIGHTYSLQDLIISKEQRLEEALWTTVTALEELSRLLRDVIRLREKIPTTKDTLEERATRASAHSAAIRRIIDQDEPTPFLEASEEDVS